MIKETPVFIVGAPRSGTTLLTAFLNSHSELDAGPETQFFNKLEPKSDRVDSALKSANWPDEAVTLVSELTLSEQSVVELFGLTVAEVKEFLLNSSPSKKVMLESLTVPHALKNKKSIWVEKTPNHICHINEIRSLYPCAKIIRITRDPRDSSASIGRLPWAPKSALINSLLVNHWYSISSAFFKTDPLSFTVKYETLVSDTEAVLKQVCQFLGVGYEQAMLNRKSAAQVGSKNEPWKQDVTQKLNSDKCFVWKQNKESPVTKLIENNCHVIIDEFGYDLTQEHKDHERICVLSIPKSRFEDFDEYAPLLQSKNCKLVKKANESDAAILWAEGGFSQQFKLLLNGIKYRFKTKNRIYYVQNKASFIIKLFASKY